MAEPNNYTLGRGELHFSRFLPGTFTPEGERYIGNTPEFNASIEAETLDHFDSDHGVKEMDESIVLQTNRNASFITDNISLTNIAYFFFGSVSSIAATAGSVAAESIGAVIPGLTYQLGMSVNNPSGARALEESSSGVNVVVKMTDTPATEYVEGVDYTIDMARARLYIKSTAEGGTIPTGTKLSVDYKTTASTRDRVISGAKPIEGTLRYLSFNPVGENRDWYMPYVKLSPNGDYALKGDDWQQIPFNVQILKRSPYEALYIDGVAKS